MKKVPNLPRSTYHLGDIHLYEYHLVLLFHKMSSNMECCPGCIGIADDVTIYGRSKKEHDRNLLNLMSVAQEEGLLFNSQICIIRASEIPFFGMIY